MELVRSPGRPLDRQIAEALATEIRAGGQEAGERLPSPAMSPARYEEHSGLERIAVRHARRAPSPTVPRSATLSGAVRALCAVAWAPLVITAGGEPVGVLTAELLVTQMLGAEPSDVLEATG